MSDYQACINYLDLLENVCGAVEVNYHNARLHFF